MPINTKIKKNISLAPMTTFKIGGPAEFFIEVKSLKDLVDAIKWAKINNKKLYWLARGSNILISDKGLRGLVIKLSLDKINVGGNKIYCQAGASLIKTSRLAYEHNLTGLEWAAGIPGSIGGAVRGNAGAFGRQMSELVEAVKVYDTAKNKYYHFRKQACGFSYRHSIFKINKNLIIIEIILKLEAGKKSGIKKRLAEFSQHRFDNQPWQASAGCVFKNVEIRYIKKQNPKLADYLVKNNIVKTNKIGAGWLIDQAGLKGKVKGGAKISQKHANFIVNIDQAKAQDVVNLMKIIKKRVKEKFNLILHEEIQYLE